MAEEKLQRKLGLFPATNIVVANMIGAGIFTTSGLLMSDLNDPMLMLLLWAAGGFIALCGAFSYGELGAAMPGAGGEYLFLSRLYHPIFGFLSGWISFMVGFSAPIAASALGFSEYFSGLSLPSLYGLKCRYYEPGNDKEITCCKCHSDIYFYSLQGNQIRARIQNVLTLLKVLLIVVLLLMPDSDRVTVISAISAQVTELCPGFQGLKPSDFPLCGSCLPTADGMLQPISELK